MKRRIEKLEAQREGSKYAPFIIVDSLEELTGRSDVGPNTVVIIDDVRKAPQTKQGASDGL